VVGISSKRQNFFIATVGLGPQGLKIVFFSTLDSSSCQALGGLNFSDCTNRNACMGWPHSHGHNTRDKNFCFGF